ncbi:MAG TPA: hypothetical protein DHW82_00090, partial [Spirochaetia bacterium]|nr:hypothetical protein [Spirochaetia bacterium]
MEIITAKNGLKVPVVKGTPLHSRIDPSKESLHFLSDQDKNKILIVVGLGFAYHLLEAQKSGQKIIVIEPDTSLISFFQKEGLENLKKITVLSGSFHEISRYLETDIPWQDMKEVVIKAHQPSLRIRPELYQPYLDFLKNWQEKKLLNLITDAAFGVLWIKNLLKNLLRPLSFPVFSNKNQSPALIIGSGSSLTETLPFIQDNQNQFILIAIPQVLKILKQYQIQPDLVVMVDSGYANRFYLEEMNVPLLTYLNSSALSIKYWKGPVYFMNSLLPFDQLLIPEFPPIPVSGSAANTVIEIASLLSSQIILTGFDFSFVHNLYHYQGNPLENELIYLSDKKYPLDQKQFQWVYPDS